MPYLDLKSKIPFYKRYAMNGAYKKERNYRFFTRAELKYVLLTRSCSTVQDISTNSDVANARYICCNINNGTLNVRGVLIIPDSFTLPDGITFGEINTPTKTTNHNQFNLEDWDVLKAAGCVFFPCGGETSASARFNATGTYPSSTFYRNNQNYGFQIFLSGSYSVAFNVDSAIAGSALIRLVSDATTEDTYSFTCNGSGKKIIFAPANLKYLGSTDTLKFHNNAYDALGHTEGNANSFADNTKWRDYLTFSNNEDSIANYTATYVYTEYYRRNNQMIRYTITENIPNS